MISSLLTVISITILGINKVHAFQHHPTVPLCQPPSNKPSTHHRFLHRHDIPANHPATKLHMMNKNHSSSEVQQKSIPLSGILGLISQPIVWSSLYLVRTTGGGYPAGPFGLLGLLEGMSYLIVVGFAAAFAWKNVIVDSNDKKGVTSAEDWAERASAISLVLALTVLLSLVVDRGCVPNAKPLLDYSDYLPVCIAEDAPGLFGQ
jgi:hypothetical protein